MPFSSGKRFVFLANRISTDWCSSRLQEETAKVEDNLVKSNFTEAIIDCFNTPKINAFDPNLLEPLLKVLRLSPSLAASLATPEMYSGIAQKLIHKKAVVRLNLLRLVRNILDVRETDYFDSPSPQLRSLLSAIQTLADKDSAVLVRNLASELVKSHIEGTPDRRNSVPSLSSSVSSSSRSRSSTRRIYTPPSLQHAASTPLTPTQASSRPSLHSFPSAAAAALIEVAQSPKRSSAAIARERDNLGLAYRPRSKDGLIYRPGSREGGGISGLPVSAGSGIPSGLPRRPSVDAQQATGDNSNSRGAGKVRLSRPSHATRPSLSAMRSGGGGESLLSNKENVASVAERLSPFGGPPAEDLGAAASGGGSGGLQPAGSLTPKQPPRERRRSRAPSSETGGRKWGT